MSSSSSSFSLPSAGGVVSLLNEDHKAAGGEVECRGRQSSRSRSDVNLQKLNIPSSYSSDRFHSRHSRRDDVSTSTSESVTPGGASPFDSNPSSGSGGESNGTSLTSMHTSADGRSRDHSFGTEDKHMASTNNSGSFSSEDNQEEQDSNKKHVNLNELGRFHIRLGTSSSSSLSDDGGNEAESQKRRRPSDSRGDETVQSRGKVMRRMLDQQRLASSPTPMSKEQQRAHEEEQQRADDHGQTANGPANGQKDVPMNMHRATARSEGGFRGKNELDDEGGGEEEKRRTDSSSRREREVSNATTSSSTAGGAGRKPTNGSQIIDGKKRYPCSFPGCDKTFSTSGHAARHNRIHTGSKPYRCTFPGCNASFSRQDNSLQHYRTHVLHPKSRSGAAIGIDGAAIDPVTIDGDLANLDPDTIATVQMGRKALEEGTAIAVVQEFIDGNGRKAEAVQRMVGQPKTARRGSNATQGSPPQSWHEATQPTHTTTTHNRRASFDEPYGGAYGHPWYGHAAPPPSHHMSGHHVEPNVGPPRHHYGMDARYAREPEPSMYGPPPPNVSYAGHRASPAYGPGGDPNFHGAHASGPSTYAHHRYNGSERGGEMAAPPTMYHGEPSHLRRQSYAAQAAHTTADFYQSQRDMQAAEEQAYHERMRRSSDAGARAADRYAATRYPPPLHYQQPVSRSTFAPPAPEFSTPNYQRAGSHSSRQSDDGRSIGLASNGGGGGQHRRTVSAVQGYHGPAYGASTYDGPHGGVYKEQHWARPSTSTNPTTSPTLSVRSFRSEGPHEHSVRDAGRGSGAALAMLSDMATQNGGAGARATPAGNAVSPTKMNGVRSAHAPTSLPPPTALSKLPYSSDRSTNILTPPVPTLLSSQHATAAAQPPPPYPHMIR